MWGRTRISRRSSGCWRVVHAEPRSEQIMNTASAAALVVVAAASPAIAPSVGIIGLGRPAGRRDTAVSALSASGDVAVGSPAPDYFGAFRWVRTSGSTGTTTVLPLTPGYNIHGTAVTADGQIVFGYSSERSAGTQQYYTVRWRPP